MMTSDDRVLVVGAGPTGLTMACVLAMHGVPCRVIDRGDARSSTSKAIAVQPRSLEVWESLGVLDAALAIGRRLHGANVYSGGKRLVHVGFDGVDCPFPFILSLPQAESERVLERHLETLGIRVERRTRLVSMSQVDDGVIATLDTPQGEARMLTRWLIGCDGAHSTVRKLLEVPFEGTKSEEAFVLGDVAIDWALPNDEVHAFFSPDGILAAIPLPGEHRWRIVADVSSSGEVPAAPDLARLEAIAAARSSVPLRLSDMGWTSGFCIHRRIVPSYRHGAIFLAGDAAHVHSPAGGQGMNTGMQDAWNLGWKLALVHKGAGRPSLLDSYSVERHPIAAATLQGTDLATRVVTMRSAVTRELRDRIGGFLANLEPVQQRMIAAATELSLDYRRSPIVGEHRLPLARHAVIADRRTEAPSMSDWFDFGAAPSAGDRAPDVEFTTGEDVGETPRRLFDVLRSTKHSALLFDGAAATAEGYQNLETIARRIRARYGKHVNVHVVVPHATAPKALEWDGSTLLDGHRALHRRYGAGSECLYMVRPDGYIGYRSQPAQVEPVMAHLSTILV
jgi:2-polyprenyl-6-methoxyphenol hydroxylase-like FAD-dependent oxidoreductase